MKMRFNKKLIHTNVLFRVTIFLVCLAISTFTLAAPVNKVVVYPAPKGIALSKAYRVSVAGKTVPVYPVKVGAADDNRRFKAVDDLMHSDQYYDMAAFCSFDMQGAATVTVSVDKDIKTAKVLPTSAGIKVTKGKRSISFRVSSPQNLTVEINGEWVRSLHIFVNPIETNIPNPKDPNVIYFGPGVHEVSNLVVGDNKTVYIAGGAIVKAVVNKNERFNVEPSGLKNYEPNFDLRGKNIKLRGRGIIDATPSPTHSKSIVNIQGSDITFEGLILINPSGWTAPVRMSDRVRVSNVKIIGYRANSDGIDIGSSRDVTIEKCFIRSNDDLIVVKSWKGAGEVKRVVVKNCVLFNQLAHALSLGAELQENVDDVLFTNCDIIHDQSREWSLRVFHSDASLISNVVFDNIRVEESRQLISLWTGKLSSSRDRGYGKIQNITFKNIQAKGNPLTVELVGGDEQNGVRNVAFKNVKLNGKALSRQLIRSNAFVKDIAVQL